MSLIMLVPDASLFHSSLPVPGLKTVKKSVLPTTVRFDGAQWDMSATGPVPVPSLLQSE